MLRAKELKGFGGTWLAAGRSVCRALGWRVEGIGGAVR